MKITPAQKIAARKFAAFFGEATPCILELTEEAAAPRSFEIRREHDTWRFRANRPSGLIAAVEYAIAHFEKHHDLPETVERRSPYMHRLLMEDFPFGCYWPTGFECDLDAYAENLAALGFTAMECNRYSRKQPLEPFHWS